VSRKQVQEPSKDDVALFRCMLQGVKHVQHLYEVGRAFESHIFGCKEFTERMFKAKPENLSTLSLGDLLRLL
jgi:hypothetical protein